MNFETGFPQVTDTRRPRPRTVAGNPGRADSEGGRRMTQELWAVMGPDGGYWANHEGAPILFASRLYAISRARRNSYQTGEHYRAVRVKVIADTEAAE